MNCLGLFRKLVVVGGTEIRIKSFIVPYVAMKDPVPYCLLRSDIVILT